MEALDPKTRHHYQRIMDKVTQNPDRWALRRVGLEQTMHFRIGKDIYQCAQALIARRRARGERKMSLSTLCRDLVRQWVEEQLREEPLPCRESTQS